MEEKYCKLIKKTIKALDNNDVCTREMRETAIQAMKEVQQYHKLGTIEQCNEATKRAKQRKQYTEMNSTQIARDAVRKYMY